MDQEITASGKPFDHEVGRYPNVYDVLRDAEQHEDFPAGDLAEVHVRLQPTGEGNWSVRGVGQDEPVRGYYLYR